MKWCECETCWARRRWRVVESPEAVPPWGHDVLIRLAALEGKDMALDLSGLKQAQDAQKEVDDEILSKLDDLLTKAGQSNSQGDQAQVAAAVVEMQQHVADVRNALAASSGGAHEATPAASDPAPAPAPAPAAGDGAVPASQPAPPAAPSEPAPAAAPVSSEPASSPASGGDAVQSAPPA